MLDGSVPSMPLAVQHVISGPEDVAVFVGQPQDVVDCRVLHHIADSVLAVLLVGLHGVKATRPSTYKTLLMEVNTIEAPAPWASTASAVIANAAVASAVAAAVAAPVASAVAAAAPALNS